MIRLLNGSTNAQTTKHFTTIRTLIPVIPSLLTDDVGDLCLCRLQCIPCLKMFTDEIGTDTYKNDWYRIYQNLITGGYAKVFIVVDDVEIEVTDDTYGKLYDGTYFMGYRFNAYNIWSEHGYGEYTFIIRGYDANDNLIKESESVCFDIQKFSTRMANKTVTITTRQNGILRHGNNYSNLEVTGEVYRGLPYWEQRVRLPGRLKRTPGNYELSAVAVNDQVHSRLQVLDMYTEAYDLEIDLVSSDQLLHVIFDNMFANKVYVTDYNVLNWENYKSVSLLRVGEEFEPRVVRRKSWTFKMVNADKKFEKFND